MSISFLVPTENNVYLDYPRQITERAHNVATTSHQRRCNIDTTLLQRCLSNGICVLDHSTICFLRIEFSVYNSSRFLAYS